MSIRHPCSRPVAVATMALLLAACGGGGGGGGGGGFPIIAGTTVPAATMPTTPPTTPPMEPAASTTLSGVAATGAAFALAKLTVIDQTGTVVCSVETDAKGAYACTLPPGTKAPLVIKAARDDQTLYSTTASAGNGIANVTPLTTIIVAQLSPNGDPASLAGAIQTQPATVTAETIQAQVTELVTALKPLLDAMGQSAINLMSGPFTADGTGQDKVLDTISVSVLPTGSSANIEITVKTVPTADGAPPVSIVFNTAVPTPTLDPIAASNLADTPTPAMVAALFDRLTACYALPLTARVGTAVNDTTNATGTAADVIAPACKTLFVGDDPATFYSNGYYVGRDANNAGSFSGIFRQGATGVVFDRGNVEFARSSTDFVLSYRNVDRFGNSDNDTVIARNVGGVLKLTGNGYEHRASVRAYSEDRELLNTPAFSAYTTGYNVSIDNKLAGGNPIFDRVLVTPPFGAVRTYVPQSGLSYLVVLKDDNTPSAGGVIRLAGNYANAATPGNPSEKENGIYFVAQQYTEAEIAALKNQSVWKLEFVPVGGTPGNPANVTQTYRTLSRAQTLGEVRQLKFAQVTPTLRAELVAETGAAGVVAFGAPSANDPNNIDLSASGNTDGWMVPEFALAPTSLTAYGRAPNNGARFNDSVNVPSLQRKGIITCSPQGVGDLHCDNSTNVLQYAAGTTVNSFELWARSSRQVEVSKKVGLYKLQ